MFRGNRKRRKKHCLQRQYEEGYNNCAVGCYKEDDERLYTSLVTQIIFLINGSQEVYRLSKYRETDRVRINLKKFLLCYGAM